MSLRKAKFALVTAAAMFCSLAAEAAVIQLSAVNAVWQNVVPQSGLTDIDYQTVGNSVQVRWGQASLATNLKSGYGFSAFSPLPDNITLGNPFLLGNFTHFNLPITLNRSILSAQLNVAFQVSVDGNLINDAVLASFTHNETTNTCSPQPTCANDLVTLDATSGLTQFVFNNIKYTLDLIGFSTDGGNTILEDFSTIERQNNTAGLYASLTAERITDVPEPEVLGLFGLALVSLALAKRRKA